MSMHAGLRRWQRLTLVACAAVALAGCPTLNYRSIQDDFNAAVTVDNVRSVDAIGALTGAGAIERYCEIQAQLTDAYVEALDDRLEPNAYAIRAVAQWRCGKLAEARDSAAKGLQRPNVAGSPRDEMVLTMIPALVIDQELVAKFKANGATVSAAEYGAAYPRDFATAAELLKSATSGVQPGTPVSIIAYVHLHRWRVLTNWSIVISKIDGGAASGSDARNAARSEAQRLLGNRPLDAEIASEEQLVKTGDPALFKAMQAIALQP
jgi:hypothetical protein